MTDKRFELLSDEVYLDIKDMLYKEDDKHLHNAKEVTEQLNELDEDIEMYITANNDLRKELVERYTQIIELNHEIEQLKEERDYYKRGLQKELVCQAIIDGREKNE